MDVARAVWGFIENRDHRLMRRMNGWRPPRWVRYWMLLATRLGDGWLWYSLGIMLLIWGGPQRFAAVGAAGAAAIAGIFLFKRLKRMSRRPRPCQIQAHCWSRVLPPDQFSFPSGHAMTAFSTAVVVSAYYPNLETALLFAAGSIAFSRIVLGMHFLSDVLAGVVLGAGLGFASLLVFTASH
jgi:undecaprenyl-diphosphatase